MASLPIPGLRAALELSSPIFANCMFRVILNAALPRRSR